MWRNQLFFAIFEYIFTYFTKFEKPYNQFYEICEYFCIDVRISFFYSQPWNHPIEGEGFPIYKNGGLKQIYRPCSSSITLRFHTVDEVATQEKLNEVGFDTSGPSRFQSSGETKKFV